MSDKYRWDGKIVSFPDLDIQTGKSGGYVTCRWGSIGFAPDAFDGPPPSKAEIDLSLGLVSYDAFPIYAGTILLKDYTDRQITYEIWEPEIEEMLLEEGTDERGETCVIPLVVGWPIWHFSPQRTGMESERKYYDSGMLIDTTPGSAIWKAYDDGVLIESGWTDNGDGTVSRSMNVVGELSWAGSGTLWNLETLFDWAAGRMGLSLEVVGDASSVMVNYVFESQEYLIDALDKVAAYFGWLFTINTSSGVLRLVDKAIGDGQTVIDSFDFISIKYSWPDRIKTLKAAWVSRKADHNSSGIPFLNEIEQEIVITGDYAVVGEDRSVDEIYQSFGGHTATPAWVRATMEKRLAWDSRPWIVMRLPMRRWPRVGERLTFTDRKIDVDVSGWVLVEKISLDYKSKEITVEGRGDLEMT